jgi:hypothetical protein
MVRRIGSGFGYEDESPTLSGPRCASVNGFSLHANTHIPAHRRDQWERLIHYTARGAVSLERLEQDAPGDLIYTFTKPWSDGTTGIKLSPVELLEKLAALAPLPRVRLLLLLQPPSGYRSGAEKSRLKILCALHVHLVAAIPHGLTVEYMPWTLRLYEETLPIEDGKIVVPQKPGLGLKFDAAVLKKYQVS